jgi:capsid protein
MRNKARSFYQNVPWVRAALDGRVSYVIGTGIVHRSTAGADAGLFDQTFRAWSEVADADGLLDYYGLQALAEKTAEQDGECLIRPRWRRPEDGRPVPLQLLEIDWLDSTKNGPNGQNTILNGIEYDMLGALRSA